MDGEVDVSSGGPRGRRERESKVGCLQRVAWRGIKPWHSSLFPTFFPKRAEGPLPRDKVEASSIRHRIEIFLLYRACSD